MNNLETIVALATPQGQSGIGVIRISGTLVPKISHKLFKKLPNPRHATYLALYDCHQNNILDNVIAIFFPKPHSFTGEDVLEIHGHGSPIILNVIIQNILNISPKYIRIASPGEFSERAFINNKIDLIQAEAIADLISATSYQSAQLSSNTLQGAFSKKINELTQQLSNLRIDIESNIDFPEEQIKILDHTKIKKELNKIINKIKKTYQNAQQSTLTQQGIKIVIVGKPNSGKSSLFNILSESESAIVTPISGTTRDTLHEYIQLKGMLIHIVDTAGLKEINNNYLNNNLKQKKTTNDTIEEIGIKRAWKEIKQAHYILLLIDSNTTLKTESIQLQSKIKQQLTNKNTPIIIIRNKADLTKEKINITHINQQTTMITISAKYNQGINLIKNHLEKNLKFINSSEGNFIARQRHIEALKISYKHLLQAKKIINYHCNNKYVQQIEIVAEELRHAYIALNQIIGKYHSNELLKKIFSKFCIGK